MITVCSMVVALAVMEKTCTPRRTSNYPAASLRTVIRKKQCKHCPNWHHLCLAKLGSENIDKCHWCNSPADLGNPETFTLLLTTYLAVGLSLAKYRTAMDPTDFYMHTNILATRLEKDPAARRLQLLSCCNLKLPRLSGRNAHHRVRGRGPHRRPHR